MANPIRTKTHRHKTHQHPTARKTSPDKTTNQQPRIQTSPAQNQAAIARSLFLAGAISSQARLVYHEQTNERNEIVQALLCLFDARSKFVLFDRMAGVGAKTCRCARSHMCQHESSEFLDPKRALWCEVAGIKVRRGLIGGAI